MHFVGDDAETSEIVNRLMDACGPGSFLAISHAASDIDAEQQTEMVRRLNQSVAEKATLRDRAGVTRLFAGSSWSRPAWSGPPSGGRTPTSRRPAPPRCGPASPEKPRKHRQGSEPATRRPACQTAATCGTPGR